MDSFLPELWQDLTSSYVYVVGGLIFLVVLLFVLTRVFRPPIAEPTLEEREPQARRMRDEKPQVLVVDDSAVVRAKLGKLLGEAGYGVTLAGDGVEAEEKLAQTRFHLLITDLEMPRMDGFALITAVHGSLATEDLPIIAITGHDELQARVHACGGIYGIFQKPWNDRELLHRVAALTQLSRQAVKLESTRTALS
ncbi:response regulator [Niveibacterium sp. SC-1]|uniref:response regulator n=1 Tax=Niveibacterium sp. SC-1 TaxID=3135646 RepID=UPI00311F109B